MLGTEKSLELVGLATINAFLALVLTITFLSGSAKPRLNKLTTANIRAFVATVTKVSTGQGTDQFGITQYLMKHIEDGSTFKTSIKYDIPNVDPAEHTVALGKDDYISHVLQAVKEVKDTQATTHIEDIHINPGAKTARVVTTSYERGDMPVTGADDNRTTLPVRSISYCEQTFILKDQTIRMAGASCSTNIETAPPADD